MRQHTGIEEIRCNNSATTLLKYRFNTEFFLLSFGTNRRSQFIITVLVYEVGKEIMNIVKDVNANKKCWETMTKATLT
jgi:hypothetical protein